MPVLLWKNFFFFVVVFESSDEGQLSGGVGVSPLPPLSDSRESILCAKSVQKVLTQKIIIKIRYFSQYLYIYIYFFFVSKYQKLIFMPKKVFFFYCHRKECCVLISNFFFFFSSLLPLANFLFFWVFFIIANLQ